MTFAASANLPTPHRTQALIIGHQIKGPFPTYLPTYADRNTKMMILCSPIKASDTKQTMTLNHVLPSILLILRCSGN
jgi:hypothetical protein